MKYQDLAAEIDDLLNRRRAISQNQYGFSPIPGHEEEHLKLSKELEQKRRELRRLRYGTEGDD